MYGFLEQLLHYFDRPHAGVPAGPVGGPAAWTGRELATADAWREQLGAEQAAELTRAVATVRSTDVRSRRSGGRTSRCPPSHPRSSAGATS